MVTTRCPLLPRKPLRNIGRNFERHARLPYDESMPQSPRRSRTTVRDFFAGVRILGTGLKLWSTDPKVMLFGAVPALIVAIVYAAGVTILLANFDPIISWIAGFTSIENEFLDKLVQFLIGLALIALATVIVIYTFVAVTLLVGDPFYERIWRRVEGKLGDVPEVAETGFWKSILDSIRFLFATIGISIMVLLIGFIPVVGTIAAPILGALFGGWFLALELTTRPFEKRGLRARDRRRALGASRATTVGFGVAVWLLFLIPFAAVFVMPAAVAGATVLSRNALGIPQRGRPQDTVSGPPAAPGIRPLSPAPVILPPTTGAGGA